MKWKLRFGAALADKLGYDNITFFTVISTCLSIELKCLNYNQATEIVWKGGTLDYFFSSIDNYIIERYADRIRKQYTFVQRNYWKF